MLRVIKKRKYKTRDLEKILDQPQPRISEILQGKINSISIEKLIMYLQMLGIKTVIKTTPIKKAA
jgi:predicted XRE-type DNA-binding protein